jgi:hypothetical protein
VSAAIARDRPVQANEAMSTLDLIYGGLSKRDKITAAAAYWDARRKLDRIGVSGGMWGPDQVQGLGSRSGGEIRVEIEILTPNLNLVFP